MANEPDEKIVIRIDLDEVSLKEATDKIEKSLDSASKSASKISSDNLSDLNDELDRTASSSEKSSQEFDILKETLVSLNRQAVEYAAGLASIGSVAVTFRGELTNLSSLIKTITNRFVLNQRGLLGFTSSISILSGLLIGFSKVIEDVDNSLVQSLKTVSLLTGIFFGSFAAAITFVTIKIGQLAREAGTFLVQGFQNSAKQFAKTSESLTVFSKFIENFNKVTNDAVGSTESWTAVVSNLSDGLLISGDSLRKASNEIIAVGSQLGLTEQELQKLLKVSAEYAKINGKDVFNSAVAFSSALAGNTQGLVSYGIKLNETSLQQFAYSKGITESVRNLSEQELVQLRLEKIFKSFNAVQGIAEEQTKSLASQTDRFNLLIEKLNTQLGRGASLVENLNLGTFALNKVLSVLNDDLVAAAGFFGALGARVLQIGGFFVEYSFKIFAVIKGIKLLNVILDSTFSQELINKRLPLLNKSIQQLATNITGTNVSFKNLKQLIISLTNVGIANFKTFLFTLLGISNAGAGFLGIIRQIVAVNVSRFALGFKALLAFLLPVLPVIIKISAIITTLVLAFRALKAVFEILERETKVFSTTFEILSQLLNRANPIIEAVTSSFNRFKEVLLDIANRVIGLFAAGLAKVFQILAKIAAADPFSIFSKEQVSKINDTASALENFNRRLIAASFDVRKINEEAKRSVAETGDEVRKLTAEQEQELRDLKTQFGQTELEQLRQTQAKRLETLGIAFEQELVNRREFETIKFELNRQFREQEAQLLEDLADRTAVSNERISTNFGALADAIVEQGKKIKITTGQIAQSLLTGFGRGAATAFSQFGKAIVEGENAFAAFGKSFLNTIGQLAIQQGAWFILQGIGYQFVPGFQGIGASLIAAGAALATFGGALSAISARGEGASGGAAVGGFAGGGLILDNQGQATNFADPDATEGSGTEVNVTIQGDVLDSDESGSRIVNLINDAFDKQGVVINREVVA